MSYHGRSSLLKREFVLGLLKTVTSLVIVAVAIVMSLIPRLGLEKEIIFSVGRAFVQLSVIGSVLDFIFKQNNVWWILAAYIFMVVVASYTAGRRAKHLPYGPYVAGLSILAGTSISLSTLLVLHSFPLTPQYLIPVTGMVVGKSMTVTGVSLKRLRDDLKLRQNEIETALALGATPKQATHIPRKQALVLALSPVLDSLKTLGLITLPGAMTGLIMAGTSPLVAIQLQLIITFFMIGSCVFSSILAAYLTLPIFFTKAHQLKVEIFIQE